MTASRSSYELGSTPSTRRRSRGSRRAHVAAPGSRVVRYSHDLLPPQLAACDGPVESMSPPRATRREAAGHPQGAVSE